MIGRFVLCIWALFQGPMFGTDCTSSQNLLNFRNHPHYAEGHQHSNHFHLQTKKQVLEGREWTRPKDYYKLNGYTVKSISATKSSALIAIEPQVIPQELAEVREANDHFVRMRASSVTCRWAQPRVVCVKDFYPGDKEFLPKCTLLHRCDAGSGCCDEKMQCGPRAMQEVALHFYVLDGDKSSNVEKLLFVNHTECECQPRLDHEPTTTSAPESHRRAKEINDRYPQGDQKYSKCRPCPPPFCARELEDGACSCDCFDKHKACTRIKRGREPLHDAHRRCVLAGHCHIPECDYGAFEPEQGRCPRRPYDQEAPSNNGKRPHPGSRNPQHRWNYFERD